MKTFSCHPGLAKLHSRRSAFTLIELLVVIAVIAILAAMRVPAWSGAGQRTKEVRCMNNLKQLMSAWQMYSSDAKDLIMPNYHGPQARSGNFDPAIGPGWASGWLDWTTFSDNINTEFLINDKWARIAPYVAKTKSVFKCPADNFLSAPQRVLGWKERVRSYSVNIGVGAGNAESGPWSSIYKHYKKVTEIRSFAATWVFIDEHPDSMNDPSFFNPASPTQMTDTPATYHNGAGGLSFADGHAEMHKWRGCLASGRAREVRTSNGQYLNNVITGPAGDPDIHYLSSRGGLVSPGVSY